jgi:hypothetical protein
MQHGATLTNLFHTIQWASRDQEIVQGLKSNWLELNLTLFLRLMHTNARPGAKDPIEAFDRLPGDSAVRLLLAPSFGYALRAGNYDSITSLVFAELALHDRSDTTNLDVWSPLGDVWLGNQPPPLFGTDTLQEARGSFHAPHLDCGLPIDFSIHTALTVPSVGLQYPQHLAPDQIKRAVVVLNAAVNLLGQINAAALGMFVALVQNIVLRSSTDRHRLRSGSSAAALGRIVLVNCDSSQIDVHDVTESLLHEAIHIAVSCTELTHPLVSAEVASNPEVTVVSPWSGARLHIHAFVHACLVWLALYRFWESCDQTESSGAWVRERLAYIRRGFESPGFCTVVENAICHLTEETQHVMLAARAALAGGQSE